MTDSNLKIGKAWAILLSCVLILMYALWWAVCVYLPYNKKKGALRAQISALEHEVGQKKADFMEFRDADESLRSSLSRIQDVRSRLPSLNNLTKFVDHLKKRGLDHNLIVEEEMPDIHLMSSPYPSRIQIYPIPMTVKLKGDFLSIGRYMQSFDEEERFFCHIKSITMGRTSTDTSTVSAQVKMEMFCKKMERQRDEVL